MLNILSVLKKLFNLAKDWLSGKFEPNISVNTIKNSSINVQNGNFVQTNTIVKFENRDSVTEFVNVITNFLHDNCI